MREILLDRQVFVKNIEEVCQEMILLPQQWMKTVKHMSADKLSHEHANERMSHREILNYIRTCDLPKSCVELLNITVNDEHEHRDKVEKRILMCNRIFE